MYEVFENNRTERKIVFDDEGIKSYCSVRNLFFPYGSIGKIKLGLLGLNIESKDQKFFEFYAPLPNSDQRQRLKALIGEVEKRNAAAPDAEAVIGQSDYGSYFEYDPLTGQLTVRRRMFKAKSVIMMVKDYDYTVDYKEEQLHVGAVRRPTRC